MIFFNRKKQLKKTLKTLKTLYLPLSTLVLAPMDANQLPNKENEHFNNSQPQKIQSFEEWHEQQIQDEDFEAYRRKQEEAFYPTSFDDDEDNSWY